MTVLIVKKLGFFIKKLDYDNNVYCVHVKEKLQTNQIFYEAVNLKTGLTVTYTNLSLFYNHFEEVLESSHVSYRESQ